MTDATETEWLSMTDVASRVGVSVQAIGRRLDRLGSKVATRKDGTTRFIDYPAFERAINSQSDPAQILRNRGKAPSVQVSGETTRLTDSDGGAAHDYTLQKARQALFDAENSKLDLEERTGKLLKVKDVENAMVALASAMLRTIDQLPSKSDDIKIKAILKKIGRELRQTIADEMAMMAKAEADGDDGAP